MEEVLAYCGLVCHTCVIYLATREEDNEKRAEMRVEIAREIKKHYGEEHRPEDIADCDGCWTETGKLFCKNCEIRKCAREKGIENCAHCGRYACKKLEKLFTTDAQAKERLDEIKAAL